MFKKNINKNLKFSIYLFITIILTLSFSISLQSLLAEWTAPTASPPNNNVLGLLNQGVSPQAKIGSLTIGGAFKADSGDNTLVVDADNDRVGIGTTNPGAKLEILDETDRSKVIIKGLGNTWNYSELSFGNTSNNDLWNLINREYSDYPNGFTIEEYTAGLYKTRIAINANSTNDGRIYLNPLHKGGVSIGSDFTAPDPIGGSTRLGDLHVFGKDVALIEFTGTGDGFNYATLTLEAQVPGDGYPHWSLINRQLSDIGGNSYGFGIEYWNGVDYDIKFAIDTDGNVGIGTKNPGEKLEVNGNVKANAFLYSSDRRLKKDIEIIPNALDKILQLEGVYFKWKDKDNNEDNNLGLIAQDVENIFPELVSTNEKTGLKAVQYGNLVAPLVEAIKEQQKQIEELKEEIKKLKN